MHYQLKEDIILRDYLALERTRLANERTLFAYIRTSLYLILAGIAFLQLSDLESLQWLGWTSLAGSVIIMLLGIWRYLQLRRQLNHYYKASSEQDKSTR